MKYLYLILISFLIAQTAFAGVYVKRFPTDTPVKVFEAPATNPTTNNCAKFDVNGNPVDAGTTCGGSGSNYWQLSPGNVGITTALPVGIGTASPTAILNIKAGTATAGTSPIKLTSGTVMNVPEAGSIEFSNDDYYATITTLASFPSKYPPAYSTTYVKATNEIYNIAYNATNPANPLTGVDSTEWASGNLLNTNQRFHIDLGAAYTITRIYFENSHSAGTSTNAGSKNFTLQGSNNGSDFADLVYANDGTWTNITTSPTQFAQHVAADVADPQYFTVTNSTAYRYYAVKIADGWGALYMAIRRIELQVNGQPIRGTVALTNGSNLTSGRVPYATTNGRLNDTTNFVFNGANLGIGTTMPSGSLIVMPGNLGIGTWLPGAALSVKTGNVGINTTSAPSALYVAGTAEVQGFKLSPQAASGFVLTSNSLGVGTWAPAASGGATSPAGGLGAVQFNSPVGTFSGNEANVSINPSGNLGIGTTNSPEKLAVVGGNFEVSGYVGIGTTTMGSNIAIMSGNVGIGTWKPEGLLQVNNNISTPFIILPTGNIGIGTTTPQGLFVVTRGNVGIGTWAPTAIFQVKGSNSTASNMSTNLGIGTTLNTNVLDINGGVAIGAANAGYFSAPANGIIIQGNIGFGTTNPQTKMSVLGGNVGIGTWTANGGNLIVNGGGNVGVNSAWPGKTMDIQGTGLRAIDYFSGDGTQGVTVTTCTGYKDGLCISGT